MSEIAEKAAREIVLSAKPLGVPEISAIVERAIAESQAPQSNKKALLQGVKRLPRYPYHTWSKGGLAGDGTHQQLVGLDDVLDLLNDKIAEGANENV